LRETDLLCLTERRLREALHDMGSGLPSVVWNLLSSTRGQAAIVLLHKRGLIGFDGRAGDGADRRPKGQLRRGDPTRLRSEFFPTLATHYVDLLGVDEAVVTVASLAAATGASLPMATYVAAGGEALAAARPGRTYIRTEDLYAWISRRPELRFQSGFLPDAATIGDIAGIAPPLPLTPQVEADALGSAARDALEIDELQAGK
jgi:hypothetical protein